MSGDLSTNLAAVYRRCTVTSRAYNVVDITSISVASVDSVALIPGLSVKCAVSTERDAVLSQDVAGEEVARLVLAVRVSEVVLVEISLGLAGGGTKSGIKWAIIEETHAVVGVVVLTILLDQRCVDSRWQVSGRVEIHNGRSVLAGRVKLGVA
jgi:hypothetical protein